MRCVLHLGAREIIRQLPVTLIKRNSPRPRQETRNPDFPRFLQKTKKQTIITDKAGVFWDGRWGWAQDVTRPVRAQLLRSTVSLRVQEHFFPFWP